tara:strand:+ start:292 stop:894 length:603 start_codon:yes stop_codon:yes gene_type:complete
MNPRTCLTKIAGKEVAFIHIPKTGGQSVHKALKMNLRRHLPVTDNVRKNEILHCDYAFAFVREPYSWATSLFYWFAQLHHKGRKRRPENAALNQWARNTDINTFWLNVDVSYLNRQTTGNMFRPQSWFLTRRDGAIHPRINIFRFENMDDGWSQVQCELGIENGLPHTNKTKGERPPLNEEAKARIDDLYATDFANFYPK